MIDTRALDLSIDETLFEMAGMVRRLNAKRVVIDSLSGFELALAPTFREDFRESLYRMMGTLTGLGVTVMATVELADSYTDLRFSPQGIAFLTDAIIIQRYVEIDGQLRRALAVVKVRSSPHSKELREYEISSDGQPSLVGPTGVVAATQPGPIDLTSPTATDFLYAQTGSGTVHEYEVNGDGSLSELGVVAGLPPGMEGIAST